MDYFFPFKNFSFAMAYVEYFPSKTHLPTLDQAKHPIPASLNLF